MDVRSINECLSRGEIDREEMWPHLAELKTKPLQFRFEFGLEILPAEAGLITIRGARQYGKTTWLEQQLHASVQQFGKGSAYYLNGDEIASVEELVTHLRELHAAFHPDAKVRRLFIDEITAIPQWEKGIKRIIDQGMFRDVLIVTTGSKALDLRRGAERLPGRKGRLARSEYIFLPISYRQFHEKAAERLGDKTWPAYLLTGGFPIACNDMVQFGHIPDYFMQLIRDWVFGEIVASGRSRLSLVNLCHVLFRYGGNAVGYAKLAREAGLANNTVASGYIEQLSDLLCVLPSWPWDPQTKTHQLRKPCKFHFVNLAAVMALHPAAPRYVQEFEGLPPDLQAMFIEWLIAQEIWRRAVLQQAENPEAIGFWASKEHEIDFVTPDQELIEVKRGRAGPFDFVWFPKVFPKRQLTVICQTPFQTEQIRGVTVEEFLLGSYAPSGGS